MGGYTPTYDADGNLTADSVHTYSWDADGDLHQVDTQSVTYDAMGRVVEFSGSSTTQIIYGPAGGKLALMNAQTLVKAMVPLAGGAEAVYNASGLAYYRHADWVGSVRLTSLPTGSNRLLGDGAYSPYGESYAETGTADHKFVGMEQNLVSSGAYPLYDALMREYNPTWGRWLTPDPAGRAAANPMNPQSWNRYAYVNNNPLSSTDPQGLCSQDENGWYSDDCFGGSGIPGADQGGGWGGPDGWEVTGGFPPWVGIGTLMEGDPISQQDQAALEQEYQQSQPHIEFVAGEQAAAESQSQSPCEKADENSLSKVPGETGVKPGGSPPVNVGGHNDYGFQVQFASAQAAANFAQEVGQTGWWGLDKGDRVGAIGSAHFKPDPNNPYVKNSTVVNVLGHRDWFNPDWGGHVLAPLHLGFDVGLGHVFGLFGIPLGRC